jgi:DNA-binding Xre family transcriptional regulator
MIKVKFKVKEFLDQHNKTPYALWKASGLSRTTVYFITGGKMDGVQFDTLNKIITGLESLTGLTVTPNDLLEVVRDA